VAEGIWAVKVAPVSREEPSQGAADGERDRHVAMI
jgi:hypothetical protein